MGFHGVDGNQAEASDSTLLVFKQTKPQGRVANHFWEKGYAQACLDFNSHCNLCILLKIGAKLDFKYQCNDLKILELSFSAIST